MLFWATAGNGLRTQYRPGLKQIIRSPRSGFWPDSENKSTVLVHPLVQALFYRCCWLNCLVLRKESNPSCHKQYRFRLWLQSVIEQVTDKGFLTTDARSITGKNRKEITSSILTLPNKNSTFIERIVIEETCFDSASFLAIVVMLWFKTCLSRLP